MNELRRKFPVNAETEYASGNSLLDLLLSLGRDAVDGTLKVLQFRSGDVLLHTNDPIEFVYFPIDMMVSTTTLMLDGSEIEVGTIGCEGMSGAQLVLGIDRVPGKTLCQIAGSAARLPAAAFLAWMNESETSRSIMLRYVQATVNALEISIACNALHSVQARCARWLLLTQDRVRRDEFVLTQEFLAMMLGVRRATVNTIEQELQGHNVIRYVRGQVWILDRSGLERLACECYRLTIDRYAE